MALLPGVSEQDVSSYNGAINSLDAYSVPSSFGLYAQNVSYVRTSGATVASTAAPTGNQVGGRLGHSTVVLITTDGAITACANWFFLFGATALSTTPVSSIIYYAPANGVRIWEQGPSPGFSTIIMAVTGAAGASFSPAGQRIYVAFYDGSGRVGFAGGQIYGWNIGSDPLFASPISGTMSFSEPAPTPPATGQITSGQHNFGFLTVTRNGYQGLLQPAADITTAGIVTPTFQPISYTATGGNTLQVVLTPSANPTYLQTGTVQLVMTTAANPAQYFAVPGAIETFNGSSITFNINISDNILAQTATDVTSYMDVLTSTVAGSPPFKPSATFNYSSRQGYCAIDGSGFPVIYFSDPNNYQFITADQHGIYLQNQAQPVQCISLRGVCYIFTQYATYSIEDNGDVPVTWTPPQLVDGQIGILSPTCVWENASSGYAVVASDRGLYIFQGGVFPALPLSYYQGLDWGRINWSVPTTVQVVDDQLHKRFIVLAPLTSVVASVTGSGPYTVTATNNPADQDFGNPLLYQTGLSIEVAGVTGSKTITMTGPNTFTITGGAGAPTVGSVIYPQTATHELTWDYTEGDTPDTAKYSLNAFSNYLAGAMTVMVNLATAVQEVWYAAAADGPIIRQNDGTEQYPYRDVSTSNTPSIITSNYETSLVPNIQDETSTIHFYHGAHFRVRGSGNLNITVYGLDGTPTVIPAASPLTLSTTPGQEILVKWFVMSEQQSIAVGTSGLDQWWTMNLQRVYYSNVFNQR
jgi:hypothetical protein